METVIDELVVRLGLDTKQFKRGQEDTARGLDRTKKHAEKTGRDIEATGKRAAEFFGQMERAALKFFTVFTAGRGFVNFTQQVVTTGANIARLSRNLGLSTDTISRWGDAVAKNGGTVEGFQGTIRTLSKALTDFNTTGTSNMLPLFNMLGISLVDGAGKAKQLDEVLLDLGEGFRRRYSNRSDAFNVASQFGIDEGTFNLLMKSQAEIRKELASQKGLTDQQAKAAENAERKWLAVQSRIEAVTRELVYRLLPAIEKLANAMAQFAEVSIPVLTSIVDWLGKAHDVTGGWSTALIAVLATLRILGGISIGGLIGQLAKAAGFASSIGAGLSLLFHSEKLGGDLGGVGSTYGKQLTPEEAEAFEKTGKLPERLSGSSSAPTGGGDPAVSGGKTRGARNNNPGNLEFHGQPGAIRESGEGRFARFQNMAQGVAAAGRQLQIYGTRGVSTLTQIISKWAPKKKNGRVENNTAAYIARMSQMTGFSPNQQLNLNDAGTLGLLIRGISTVENGRNVIARGDMLSGLQQLRERPAKGAPPISIGQIVINSNSQDGEGLARDFRAALVRQADTGMR